MNDQIKPAGHVIRLAVAPEQWHKGLPIGNGELGAMFWGAGSPLNFTLDRADLWDLRANWAYRDDPRYTYKELRRLVQEQKFAEAKEVFEDRVLRDNPVGPTKISIGRAELKFGEAKLLEVSLDLDQALICGQVQTPNGLHTVEAFIHRQRNVLCLQFDRCPPDAVLDVMPLAQISPAMAALNHPAPERREEGGVTILAQQIPEGPAWAVAWTRHGDCFYLSAETGTNTAAAMELAQKAVHVAVGSGYEALREQHIVAWREFWTSSAVQLPEADLERLWYEGVYLLASSAKRGFPPPGLQGLWAMDGVPPPWRGDYHADMNVQETFWPAAATGHLELLDAWCDYMRDCIPKSEAFTQQVFGTEGTFWPVCTVAGFTQVPTWHTVEFSWSHSGWLAWLAWLRWSYSMDTQWLRQTGYAVIAGVFRFYRANLEADSEGRLHVPLSSNPEYRENLGDAWARDPNIDLALIRRCCDWIVELETALELKELSPSANDIRKRLAPYALTEQKVLCLWPAKPLDDSHRHPSHLMAIHPAMDLTIDGDAEQKAIINASVDQYLALGKWKWAGHTYVQLVGFAAVLGRGDWAYENLLQFRDHWIGTNGLHFNADLSGAKTSMFQAAAGSVPPFTMEANNAMSAGICDMLVQGWGGVVRIFPAIPLHWRDVSFRDLRCEGAFRVSAERRAGLTCRVRVTAETKGVLKLRNPFGNTAFTVEGAAVEREGDFIIASLKQGQSLGLSTDTSAVANVAKGIK